MNGVALLAILHEIEALLEDPANSPRISDLMAHALEVGARMEQQFATLMEDYMKLSIRHRAWQRTGLSLSSRNCLTVAETVSMDYSRPIQPMRRSGAGSEQIH